MELLLYPLRPIITYKTMPKTTAGTDREMKVYRQPIALTIAAAISGVRTKLAVPPIW